MTAKGHDIARRFDEARMDIRNRSFLDKEAENNRYAEAVSGLDEKLEDQSKTIEQKIIQTENNGYQQQSAMREEVEALKQERAKVQMQRNVLEPDREIMDRKIHTASVLEQARNDYEEIRNKDIEAASNIKDAKHDYNIAQRDLEDAQGKLADAMSRLYATEAEYNPKDGSLLSFLRRNHPNWGDQIGKVINPDLLQKTNLSPDILEETSSGIYGLLIDLDKVEPSPHADDTALEARMMKASNAVDEAEKSRADAEAALKSYSKVRKSCEDAYARTQATLGVARKKLDAAILAEQTVKHDLDRHIKEKGASFDRQIEMLDQRIQGIG